MRIAIVDDEPLARQRLRAQVEDLQLGVVVAEAATGLEALAVATELRPDVMLLDIRMPGMDGIEAARHLSRLEQPPAIVFTTAYDQHALAAFEAHAIDYLLKPIRRERLQAALKRARIMTGAQLAEAENARDTRLPRTHFSALVKGDLRIVPVRDVRYLQADQGYVSVCFPGGMLLIEEALRTLELELGDAFLRIHRNTLVAIAHVSALERDRLGNVQIVLRDCAEKLSVSRRLLGQVRRRIRA